MAEHKKYEEEKQETTSTIEHLKNAPGYALGIGIAVAVILPMTGWWLYSTKIKKKKPKKKEDSDI